MSTLYHYTTAAGLIGIIETKSFWASDHRFLNDTSELSVGLAVLKEEIDRHENEVSSISPEAWFSVSSLVDGLEKTAIVAFVASFTTQGDLLSQWRGYNNGKGYALGINDDWLNQNAGKQNFQLVPVVYDPDVQRRSAAGAVGLLLEMLEDAPDPSRLGDLMKRWWQHALKVALACKDRHFEEESEQRLVHVGQFWPAGTKVRVGPGGMIPYKPVRFDERVVSNPLLDPKNLGLEELIIGPSLRPQQVLAVAALLAANHMRFRVRASAIPYVAD